MPPKSQEKSLRSRLLKKIARCARHVGACGVEGLSFDRRRRAADVPAVQLGRATLFRAVANEVFHSTPPPVRVCVVSGLRQVRARARDAAAWRAARGPTSDSETSPVWLKTA